MLKQPIPKVATGWQKWTAKGVANFSLARIDAGNQYSQKIAAGNQPVDAIVYQDVAIPPRTKTISAQIKIKSSDANSARFKVVFLYKTKNNARVIFSRTIGYAEGAKAWIHFKKTVDIPKKANYVRVVCRLNQGKPGFGSAYFDELKIAPLKVKNGDFENKSAFLVLKRYESLFWDPNVLAKFAVFTILLLLFLGTYLEKSSYRILAFLVALALMTPLILTLSRSGLLSLLGGCLVFFLMMAISKRKTNKAFLSIILAFILALTLLVYSPPQSVKRLANNSFDNVRLNLMSTGIKMINSQPLTGFGLGSFSDVYSIINKEKKFSDVKESHNSFITIASEFGLIGLSSFLWILTLIFYQTFRRSKKGAANLFVYFSVSVLISFLINSSLYGYFFEDPYTWLALGVASWSLTANKSACGK